MKRVAAQPFKQRAMISLSNEQNSLLAFVMIKRKRND